MTGHTTIRALLRLADRVGRVLGLTRRRLFLAVLVGQVVIVVTGGIVRLSGSGLGCPTWPRCTPRELAPAVSAGWTTWIEFANRILAVALGLLVTVALASALVERQRRSRVAGSAWLQLAGVLAQGVIGGLSVLASLAPVLVAAHFLVSGLLVAGATVLYLASGDNDPGTVVPTGGGPRRMAWILAVVVAATVIVGTVAVGSGPHAGDAGTTVRFSVDHRIVGALHAGLAVALLTAVVMLGIALRHVSDSAEARRLTRLLMLTVLVQMTVGGLTVVTGLQPLGVLVHMLGACILIVLVTALVLALSAPGNDEKSTERVATAAMPPTPAGGGP